MKCSHYQTPGETSTERAFQLLTCHKRSLQYVFHSYRSCRNNLLRLLSHSYQPCAATLGLSKMQCRHFAYGMTYGVIKGSFRDSTSGYMYYRHTTQQSSRSRSQHLETVAENHYSTRTQTTESRGKSGGGDCRYLCRSAFSRYLGHRYEAVTHYLVNSMPAILAQVHIGSHNSYLMSTTAQFGS